MSGNEEDDYQQQFLNEFLKGLKAQKEKETKKKQKRGDNQNNSNNRNEGDEDEEKEENKLPSVEEDMIAKKLFESLNITGQPRSIKIEGTSIRTSKNKIFFFKPSLSQRVWSYDEEQNVFALLPNLIITKYLFVAVTLLDRNIVLIGGWLSPDVLKSCELFNATDYSFTPLARLNQERYSSGAALLRDGRIFVVGGSIPSSDNSCEILDPVNRTSISLNGKMKYQRVTPAVVCLPDGRVMVYGGFGKNKDDAGTYLDKLSSTEIYDPVTDSFQDGPQMLVARSGLTATLLLNGEVLICGGEYYQGCSCEIYNWHSNTFREGPPMIKNRRRHCASLLSDGRVIICHDELDSYNEGTSEIFDPNMHGPSKGGFLEGPVFRLS
jgi:hypothetical protein